MLVFETPDGFKIIAILSQPNRGEKTPDNLDFLAEEGSGAYQVTEHVFGPSAADVMNMNALALVVEASTQPIFSVISDRSPVPRLARRQGPYSEREEQ
jgi:hypothetical protein